MKRIKILASMIELSMDRIFLFYKMLDILQGKRDFENKKDNHHPETLYEFFIQNKSNDYFKDCYSQLNQAEQVKWDKISEAWKNPGAEDLYVSIFSEAVLIFLLSNGLRFRDLSWDDSVNKVIEGGENFKYKNTNTIRKNFFMELNNYPGNREPFEQKIFNLINKENWGIEEIEEAYFLSEEMNKRNNISETTWLRTIKTSDIWDWTILYNDCFSIVQNKRDKLGPLFDFVYKRKNNDDKLKRVLEMAYIRQLDLEMK